MNYSTYLCCVMATFGRADAVENAPPDTTLEDAIGPALEQFRQVFQDFSSQSVTPQRMFELEGRMKTATQELNRAALEWQLNHLESSQASDLPLNVELDAEWHTRRNDQTRHEVSTTFGKVSLWRMGYRPTDKSGGPTIFPLEQQLGLIAGATPALAERAAYYQAEAGATQRRTLERLKQEHNVAWGAPKLREVVGHVAEAMADGRHEVQVEKLLELLEQSWSSTGRHKPVLSVGRDGISFGVPVKGGPIYEVASAGTVSVYDRRGKRLGTVYLAYTPESKQPRMTEQLTRLVREVLQRWDKPLPRLCYVTDAGDNETTYYNKVLRRMRHPRTGERLDWVRVLDYYHASEYVGKMAEALFGKNPAGRSWVRRMLKLLKKPNGIRRVLNSASVLRARYLTKGKKRQDDFRKAYDYLRRRTKFMRYAGYKRVGIPCGSGVTEAACKTIYTQRLKLSGMRWKMPGAQTVLHLRVMLLSGVWREAYQRLLTKLKEIKVPPYNQLNPKTRKIAA
jgi:hypothetical protein